MPYSDAQAAELRILSVHVGFGPACGPHGFFRVDEWDITKKLTPGKNLVAIEVAGYNCNSLYLLDQPSFCQAEIVADGRVLASTAGDGTPQVIFVQQNRTLEARPIEG